MVCETSYVFVKNSKFINNFAPTGSFLYSYENDEGFLFFENCVINNSLGKVSAFEISNTQLVAFELNIFDMEINLFQMIASRTFFFNLNISKVRCVNSFQGCLFSAEQSNITLINIFFYDIISLSSGAGFFLDNVNLLLIKSEFKDIYSYYEGSAIISNKASIYIISSNFKQFNGEAMVLVSGYTIITRCLFDNRNNISERDIPIHSGSIISIKNGLYLMLHASSFTRHSLAEKGGVVLVTKDIDYKTSFEPIFFFYDSVFENNAAQLQGGAIFIKEESALLSNNSFKANRARFGGAVYYNIEGNLLINSKN